MSNRQEIDAHELEKDPFELLRLDNQLCFALYAATRALTKTHREKLEKIGLTYPQYLVLLTLWQNNNLTISQIGDKLMLDSGTLTPLVKRLEVMKLVERVRDENDQRQVHVKLTDKGENLKRDALDARKYVACRLDMSEEEIMTLRADLMDMVGRLGNTDDLS